MLNHKKMIVEVISSSGTVLWSEREARGDCYVRAGLCWCRLSPGCGLSTILIMSNVDNALCSRSWVRRCPLSTALPLCWVAGSARLAGSRQRRRAELLLSHLLTSIRDQTQVNILCTECPGLTCHNGLTSRHHHNESQISLCQPGSLTLLRLYFTGIIPLLPPPSLLYQDI